MTLFILAIFLAVVAPSLAWAEGNVNALFDRALGQLVKSGYTGDTSAAERYLQAVLEEQPNHVEANWQLVYLRLVHLKDRKLSDRVDGLAAIGPAFHHVADLAKNSNDKAFLHFITAIHAGHYNNFYRAAAEIDRALALEPHSIRYRMAKAKLLVDHGTWAAQDERIEQGIALLKQTREEALERPTPFAHDANFGFYLATATSNLSKPRWDEIAEYYRQFIVQSTPSVAYAFALNNASIAYKELGECQKAKETAEQALQVMNFGAAESNKRYAELCLEMQKMGLIRQREKQTASMNPEPSPNRFIASPAQ